VDDGRQYLLARQSVQAHMLFDLLEDGGHHVGEGDDMLVLRAFTYFAEARVVTVLLAAFRVAPRCLNVAIREGAYPDFGPRGRDRERFDPFQDIFFGQLRTVRARVTKAVPAFLRRMPGRASET
jgi:hypothetical protein